MRRLIARNKKATRIKRHIVVAKAASAKARKGG
jgi:hypothetical protein